MPLADQREADLLWIEFLESQKDFGKYIMHGHTPVRGAEVLAKRADTGGYATGIAPCYRFKATACSPSDPP